MPFEPVPTRPNMSWMEGRASDPSAWGATGHFLTGWADQIWILNAMWENPSIPDAITYADVDQILSDVGELPRIVTDFDGLEPKDLFSGEVQVGFQTGVVWGLTVPPGPPWVRLTWREYMERNGLDPDPTSIPCSRWIGWDFRTNVEPPGEGSLDLAQLSTLEALLLDYEHGRDPHSNPFIHAWFSFFAPVECVRLDPGEEPDFEGRLFHGPLDQLTSLSAAMKCSPNNIWPEDRNWFITTNVDAWATLVQGPSELIDLLRTWTVMPTARSETTSALVPLEVHETFDSSFTPSSPRATP